MKVTKEQVEDAVKYLDTISKGKDNMELNPEINGGGSENISELKSELVGAIKKAKELKEKIDELEKAKSKEEELDKEDSVKKSELEDGNEEKEESEDKDKEDEKPDLDKEEIIKSIKSEVLETFKDTLTNKDEEITLLKSKINDLTSKMSEFENTPIRKSFTGEPLTFKDRFEKAQNEGKTVVSKTLQKSTISNHIYNLFVETTDEFEKGELGNAISQFESAGYLDPAIQAKLSTKYNIEII